MRTSLVFSSVASLFLFLWESGRPAAAFLEQHAISLGFLSGSWIVLSVVALWSWTAHAIVREPGEGLPRGRGFILATQLVKVPLVLLAMWVSCKYLRVNVLALAAGLGVWFLVAVLKLASILMLSPSSRK